MSFSRLAIETLNAVLEKRGFELIEESEQVLSYELDGAIFTLVHNARENSNSLWIGNSPSDNVEINDAVMREHYGSDIKLQNLTQRDFLANVFRFLVEIGDRLLGDDLAAIENLLAYSELQYRDYTTEILVNQTLQAANKSWKEGSFAEVIKQLEKLDLDNLPQSYKLKYEISLNRISG